MKAAPTINHLLYKVAKQKRVFESAHAVFKWCLAKSAFVRFSRGFRKQWLSSIYTVIDTWGMEYFADWLEKSVNDEISKGRVMVKEELQQNLRDGKRYYEEQTGLPY